MRSISKSKGRKTKLGIMIKNSWQIYVLALPAVIYFFIFNYMPIYGIQIAFKDYRFVDGIWGSSWVGLEHFKSFFSTYYFKRLLSNTFILNLYNVLWTSPCPVILAIMLNRIRNDKRKRLVQTTIYVPHFISMVVLAGMIYMFLSPGSGGVFNTVRAAFGLAPIDLMSKASAFRTIYIASGIWKEAGYSSILFIATLTSVDPGQYEAAEIDGASIWQEIRYIDIPSVIPTFMMTFILKIGGMLSSSESKVLLLQTGGNLPVSDVIGTYVYNVGLGSGQFSYTSAIGLFTNVVNFILIIAANKLSKKVTEVGMF